MAQLSAAIDGIAEACTALGTPITGGNVSLYNETKGVGIYPTPVLGVVGILDDVTKAVASGFQREGDDILAIYVPDKTPLTISERKDRFIRFLGTTEFARAHFNAWWGELPNPNLAGEAVCNNLLAELASARLITSASDVGSGGLAVCLARNSIAYGIGAEIDPMIAVGESGPDLLDALSIFMETEGVVVTCAQEDSKKIISLAEAKGLACNKIGRTISSRLLIVAIDGVPFIDLEVSAATDSFYAALESQLSAEVLA
jgi:phosphoribosylformylglycinamidine synthase